MVHNAGDAHWFSGMGYRKTASIPGGGRSNGWKNRGVPDIRTVWIKLHYGPKARV